MKCRLNRRQFIAGMGAVAAGSAMGCRKKKPADPVDAPPKPVPPRRPAMAAPPRTRPARPAWTRPAGVAGRGQVLEVVHEHALDSKDQPAAKPVAAMLDHLMRELTGKSKVEDAWALFFRPGEKVGIKPNCRGGPWCSPSAALLDAVIERLQRVGIKPADIWVWELAHFADHPLYKHLKAKPIQMKLHPELGFSDTVQKLSTGKSFHFNKAVHHVDAILNISTFKDHGRAGVTGALKNLAFGSIDNPREHHDDCCNPSTAEIYAKPVAAQKVRLTLADVFRLIYNKGPTGFRSRAWNIPYHRLYAATDPVALDREQWQVIDALRKKKSLPLLMKRFRDGEPIGRPHHVLTAAKLGLGEADYAKVRVRKKKLG